MHYDFLMVGGGSQELTPRASGRKVIQPSAQTHRLGRDPYCVNLENGRRVCLEYRAVKRLDLSETWAGLSTLIL